MITNITPKSMKGKYAGLAADKKPLTVQNGSVYFEVDTGKYFMFDEENKIWHEQKDNGGGGGSGLDAKVQANTEAIDEINARLDGIGVAEGIDV